MKQCAGACVRGDRSARTRAQTSGHGGGAGRNIQRTTRRFRKRYDRERRGSKDELTRRCSMSSLRGEADEGDEETKKFRTGRGRRRRGEEVPATVELGGGVVDVEEEEVDVLVCSAKLHGVPASTAFSAPSPNSPDFQRRQKGNLRGERWRRRGKERRREARAWSGAVVLLLLRGKVARGRAGGGGALPPAPCFRRGDTVMTTSRGGRGRAGRGAGLACGS